MDKSSRNNLDDRQDADLKYYFFHQIVVLQECIGAVVQCLTEVEPGHQSRCQEKYKRHFHALPQGCAGISHDLVEDDVIHRHGYHRLCHRPDRAQVRTSISLFKIVFRQLPDQMSILE